MITTATDDEGNYGTADDEPEISPLIVGKQNYLAGRETLTQK
ncbi:MAG: hypothetical protein V1839_01240 [archaeon]